MAVNQDLSLQTTQPNTGEIVRQANQDQNADALNAEQVLKAHLDNMNTRDQSRLRSTIVGAAQLKAYLDKGDLDGAHDFLTQRQQALHTRMGNGEDVDDQETAYALDKLRRGDIDGLKNDVYALTAAGQAYGMIGGVDGTPSSVREWQYYNSLSAEDQKRWRDQKRAGSNIDLGDKVVRLDAGGTPTTSYDKGVSPDKQPANVANAAAAGVVGTEQGTAQAKLQAMRAQLPRIEQVVTKLSGLAKTATYTKAGVAANEVARQLGAKVPQGAVDRTDYMATVDNEVLPLLRQTFGAAFTLKEGEDLRKTLGDPDKSPEEKERVLRAFVEQKKGEIESLQRQTQAAPQGAPAGGAPAAPQGAPAGGAPAAPQGAPAGGAPAAPQQGLIKMSNGKETYMVSPEDAAQAQAEGFQPVQ